MIDNHDTAYQRTLEQIVASLQELDQKIGTLLAGQQSDRIADIVSGVELVEQARATNDPELQRRLLSDAIVRLSSGRARLSVHLEAVLSRRPREPRLLDRIYRQLPPFFPDRPRIELRESIVHERDLIIESVKRIHQASVHTIGAYACLGEIESARVAFRQYLAFCDLLANDSNGALRYLPYEIEHNIRAISNEGRALVQQTLKQLGSADQAAAPGTIVDQEE